MATSAAPESAPTLEASGKAPVPDKSKDRRTIPGNFSYTTTPGKLKTALDKIIEAERPETFNKNFVETYLGVSGGSAAPIPNILKRVGFISGEGRPTDVYARFQTDGGRAEAALEGLKAGFGELFKKNTFAHSLPEEKVKDLLVEITGLTKNDAVLRQIYETFEAFRSFIPSKFIPPSQGTTSTKVDEQEQGGTASLPSTTNLGLSYHINIVLPETKDIAVFNAIFQSLKQNLLSS
jgi:Family of unknown function (DUF5343)